MSQQSTSDLFTSLNSTIPDSMKKLVETKGKIGGIISHCTSEYLNKDKEGSYTKTEGFIDAALVNVLYFIQTTSVGILDMLDLQSKEIDKLAVEVDSLSSRVRLIKNVSGMEEFNKFYSPKTTLRTRKFKKVKIAEEDRSLIQDGYINWDLYDKAGVSLSGDSSKTESSGFRNVVQSSSQSTTQDVSSYKPPELDFGLNLDFMREPAGVIDSKPPPPPIKDSKPPPPKDSKPTPPLPPPATDITKVASISQFKLPPQEDLSMSLDIMDVEQPDSDRNHDEDARSSIEADVPKIKPPSPPKEDLDKMSQPGDRKTKPPPPPKPADGAASDIATTGGDRRSFKPLPPPKSSDSGGDSSSTATKKPPPPPKPEQPSKPKPPPPVAFSGDGPPPPPPPPPTVISSSSSSRSGGIGGGDLMSQLASNRKQLNHVDVPDDSVKIPEASQGGNSSDSPKATNSPSNKASSSNVFGGGGGNMMAEILARKKRIE